jgi:hypothetical protein
VNARIAWRTAVVSALLISGCGTADVTSQGTSTSGASDPRSVSQGIPLTQTVPSAEVSAASASAAARVGNALNAAPGAPPTFPRAIPRLRGPWPVELPSLFDPIPSAVVDTVGGARFTAAPAPFAVASPAPVAPAVLSSFVGLVDDLRVIPPDTMGAAGPNHLVSFLNSEVGFFLKTTGVRLNPGVSLFGFWSPLISANLLPTFVFDPKVIYDTGSGRFIAVTLDGRLPMDNSSWILLAVSRTSDPTAGWSTWALPVDNTGVTWADFPGLGVDNNNVFINGNMFDGVPNFQHGKIFRIPKPQLLPSPQATTLTWTEFVHPEFTLQPAHTFGAASAEYFLTEGNIANVGGISSIVDLHVYTVTGSPPALVSIGSVPITPYPLVNSLQLAPNDNVDTGDTRILNVVQRNGHLYATHTVSNTANTKTEVAWYEIVPSSPPTLIQQGRVTDPARFYYYPSIAVNINGDIALGFSGSSSTEFPGAYYTARLAADAPGSTQAVGLLKAGESSYFKTFGTASDPNRWGDYSATVVDPTDNLTFWTLQEYARTSSGTFPNTGRWGTWWGSFLITDIVAPDNVVATLQGNLTVQLTWNDRATNDINYVVERKAGAGGAFAVLTFPRLPANSTSYTDNSGLALGSTYFYRVGAVSANSTAYSSEVQVVIPAPPSSGGGGGGGCMSITRSGGEPPDTTSLLSVGILLLPACALGFRRYFRRRKGTVPIRHPLC